MVNNKIRRSLSRGREVGRLVGLGCEMNDNYRFELPGLLSSQNYEVVGRKWTL